jgi:hypothetical protein
MITTNQIIKERTDESGCDNGWCDGRERETLPCFDCFDPSRAYDVEAGE